MYTSPLGELLNINCAERIFRLDSGDRASKFRRVSFQDGERDGVPNPAPPNTHPFSWRLAVN